MIKFQTLSKKYTYKLGNIIKRNNYKISKNIRYFIIDPTQESLNFKAFLITNLKLYSVILINDKIEKKNINNKRIINSFALTRLIGRLFNMYQMFSVYAKLFFSMHIYFWMFRGVRFLFSSDISFPNALATKLRNNYFRYTGNLLLEPPTRIIHILSRSGHIF